MVNPVVYFTGIKYIHFFQQSVNDTMEHLKIRKLIVGKVKLFLQGPCEKLAEINPFMLEFLLFDR